VKTLESYDPFLFALAVWREARGESLQGKLGVAWCIRNRMTDRQMRWPATPGGVVLQRLQFSCFNADDANATKLPAAMDPAWLECCRVVDAVQEAGSEADPTHGANHYHSFPASRPELWPAWADPAKQTAIVGRFYFYKR
jgi:spore germination cell wall hydrolase CwlJ-like protein